VLAGFPEIPQFDFRIINRPDTLVVGAAEVVITAMVAAIGNAMFDTTGARLRQVPFTPARVQAALTA
jgi:CO/xanthine dehydrogenase Mo-binding subunit